MIVEVKGISKIYSRQGETVTALQDVGAQERIGIAGGSGSGKSTLLRLLSLQETPTVGELNLFGRSVSEWKGHEKELYRSLQMMFQNSFHSISPRMALGEFMLEPCVNFGIGTKQEAIERCEWWLSKVEPNLFLHSQNATTCVTLFAIISAHRQRMVCLLRQK